MTIHRFKTSTLPSLVPRASDDTESKQDKMPAITAVVEQNNTTTENKTVTESKNDTDKGSTTVLTTKIQNISETEIHTGNNTIVTKSM